MGNHKEDDAAQRAADFSPRLLGVMRSPPAPLPRAMLYILLALVALVIVWAFVGRLDVVARAGGELVPQTRIKIVQPVEGGRVSNILVREGQRVEAGETLMLMDARISQADTRKLEDDLALARLQLRRVRAELEDEPLERQAGDDPALFAQVHDQYEANRESHRHRLSELEATLQQAREDLAAARETRDKLAETLPIYKKGEAAYAKLGAEGFARRLAVMDRQRERIEVERDLQSQRHAIESLRAQIDRTRSRVESLRANYRKNLLDEQLELQHRIAGLAEDLNKQRVRNERMALRAPQAGYVQDLATHTVGSVVPSGTVLMNVVPVDEPLQAEVYVAHKDIGFVTEGQEAEIKIAAYDFQRYGMVPGEVVHVSADAVQAQGRGRDNGGGNGTLGYRALIALERQSLARERRRFELRPGMRVSAEINLGTRSVMDYVLSPIRKGLSEAARQR